MTPNPSQAPTASRALRFLRKPPSPLPHLRLASQAFLASEKLFEAIAKAGVIVGVVLTVGYIAMALRLNWAWAEALGEVRQGLPVEGALAVIPRLSILVAGSVDAVLITVVALGFLAFGVRSIGVLLPIVLVMVLVVPLSVPGLLWPAGLLFVTLLARFLARKTGEYSSAAASILVVGSFLAALVAVLGRYQEPPTHFPIANTWVTASELPNRDNFCPRNPEHTSASLICVEGFYLSSDDRATFLGIVHSQEIIVIPSNTVKEIRLFPSRQPARQPFPEPSIIGRWMDASSFSATPLTIWWKTQKIWAPWE